MALRLIQVTGAEPVTLAEAKLVARIDADITAEDALVTSLISAARSEAEQIMCRAVVTQQYEIRLDAFPDGAIRLAWPHVETIDSVIYIDANGDPQTWGSANYILDNREQPGWVLTAEDVDWPTTQDTANAVRVLFTSAWAEGGGVPEDVKTWIKLRVATSYKFREGLAAGLSLAEIPRNYVDGLLDRWKVYA